VSEARRHVLYEEVKELLSVDSANEFIAALPPVGWGDVATKADLTLIRHEIATQGAELRGEIADLRGRMEGRFEGMESRFGGRFEAMESRFEGLAGQMQGMRGELLAEIANAKDSMRVWTIATLITLALGMAGIILSVTQLHR
jgi:hypothetical protein